MRLAPILALILVASVAHAESRRPWVCWNPKTGDVVKHHIDRAVCLAMCVSDSCPAPPCQRPCKAGWKKRAQRTGGCVGQVEVVK